MGNMKDLVGMISGVLKVMKDVEIEDDVFKYIEVIIYLMILIERSKFVIIDVKRKVRIVKGLGMKVE